MSLEISPYHQNNLIGLTAWNSEAQAYYLIPFAEVSSFFKQVSKQITIPEGLVDAAFGFMSEYDPETEIVLLTLNVDLLTVAVINKYEPATKEAKAEKLGWSLPKYTSFEYLQVHGPNTDMDEYCRLFNLAYDEYDQALMVLNND
jgi:hypothetical protein